MSTTIESFGDLFFFPGNYVLSVLLSTVPQLARLLGLSADDYSGVESGILSALIWLAALILLGAAYEKIRAIDRAMTQSVRRLHDGSLRRVRMLRIRAAAYLHRLKHRARTEKAKTAVQLDAYDLGDAELAVLRAHAALRPGYMMTALDLAHTLGMGLSESEQTLHRLGRLQLIEHSLGAEDGVQGYVLTSLGKSLLRTLIEQAEG